MQNQPLKIYTVFLSVLLVLLSAGCSNEQQVFVNHPPAEVKHYLSNLDHYENILTPRFSAIETAYTTIDSVKVVRFNMMMPGISIPQELRLQKSEIENSVLLSSSADAPFPMDLIWLIEPKDEGSLVTLSIQYEQEDALAGVPIAEALQDFTIETISRMQKTLNQ